MYLHANDRSYSEIRRGSQILILLTVCLALIPATGCLHEPEDVEEPLIDISAFKYIWETYEENYPLFAYKEINWISVGEACFPQAMKVTDDDELLVLIGDMLSTLEDPALILITPQGDTIRTYTREYQFNVDMTVLMENYLEPNGFLGFVDGFGRCDPSVLPYACFTAFPDISAEASQAFDEFIGQCVALDVPAVILDVRMNPTGFRDGAPTIPWFRHFTMSRFLAHSWTGAVYRSRLGAAYDQYTDLHPAIDPAGPQQYLGTVYLLVGGGCTQAAEDMAVNMAHFQNTVLVGETTAGSNTGVTMVAYFTESNEEWEVSRPYCTLLTHQHEWVENVGIAPDIHVESTPEDFAAGVDPVLEYAMELIEQSQ